MNAAVRAPGPTRWFFAMAERIENENGKVEAREYGKRARDWWAWRKTAARFTFAGRVPSPVVKEYNRGVDRNAAAARAMVDKRLWKKGVDKPAGH